jgi:hypothetical protein
MRPLAHAVLSASLALLPARREDEDDLPDRPAQFALTPVRGYPGDTPYAMDVLSEVLKVVKLEGAVFYNGEFSAPWSFTSPAACKLADYLAPGSGHVIIYHLLTEGRGYAQIDGGARLTLEAGDIVIFPHGDPHTMGNGPVCKPLDSEKELVRIMRNGLNLVQMGGGGEVTRLI